MACTATDRLVAPPRIPEQQRDQIGAECAWGPCRSQVDARREMPGCKELQVWHLASCQSAWTWPRCVDDHCTAACAPAIDTSTQVSNGVRGAAGGTTKSGKLLESPSPLSYVSQPDTGVLRWYQCDSVDLVTWPAATCCLVALVLLPRQPPLPRTSMSVAKTHQCPRSSACATAGGSTVPAAERPRRRSWRRGLSPPASRTHCQRHRSRRRRLRPPTAPPMSMIRACHGMMIGAIFDALTAWWRLPEQHWWRRGPGWLWW